MWETTDHNFLIGVLDADLVAPIFGPVSFFEHDSIQVLPDDATMLDVLVLVGVFPSKGQARKNFKGSIEIPEGSSVHSLGKRRVGVFIHKVPR